MLYLQHTQPISPFLSLKVPSPTITEFQLGINDSYTYTWARNSSSNDLSNAGGTFNQNGNLLIYVQTDINCADVSVDLINAAIFYTIPLSNTSTPMIWTGFMRLNQPDINYLTEAALGGYNLTIHATPQGSGSESSTVFVNVFSIEAPTTPNQTNWTEIIIIIAVVAAAAVTILLIIRRTRLQAHSTQADVEMSKGPAKAKHGKIYSGASAVGRASGAQAQILQQRRSEKTGVPSSPPTLSISKPATPTISKPATPSISASPSITPLASNKIPDSDKEIEEMLKGDTATVSAVKMKQAEAAVDVRRRMDFLSSSLLH